MRKPGVNSTRQHVIEFIREFYDDRGYAPTVRDIMKGCNLSSTAVVQHHLKVLESEHQIERDSKVFRSIQLPDRKSTIRVPVLGKIAAGSPIPVLSSDTWSTEAIDTVELTQEMTKGKELFALKVSGHSMIDALIDDGDIVLMHPTNTADNGDMIAAWLKKEQEVTLKRYYKEDNRVRLQPANYQMQPIYTETENLEVQGKVVAVLRNL
ncbi:MAG: transcriptional repressor LexA [Dehalococcoidia bacterium]|nr:transcriptional repressor LexA [Dehalococcoidia bacterium]MDD5495107.1 transcriptional repressor LexA [Dehalococcoidia bacterium]